MAGAPGKHGAMAGVTPESGPCAAGGAFGQAEEKESAFTAALAHLDMLHRQQVASLLQELALLRGQNQRLRLETCDRERWEGCQEQWMPEVWADPEAAALPEVCTARSGGFEKEQEKRPAQSVAPPAALLLPLAEEEAKPSKKTEPKAVLVLERPTSRQELAATSPKSLGPEARTVTSSKSLGSENKGKSFVTSLVSKKYTYESDEHEEEEPMSRVEWLAGHPLDITATCFIIANTIVMIAYSQWQGYENHVVLGLEPPGGWSNAESVFKAFEYVFTSVFLIELIIRLSYRGRVFLKDHLNCLDAVVVLITSLDTFILSQFDLKMGVSAVRLIRMVKMAKAFRMARALKLVEPLRILLRTIKASILSLVWSMVILFLFMLVSAILLSQMLQSYIIDETAPWEDRIWVDTHYGDAAKALWTMFEITLSGGWPTWVSPLVQDVSAWYALFFGVYVSLVVFAVIRVITALFLKTTLAEAAKDKESLVQERIKGRKHDIQKLSEIFDLADRNTDGSISEPEFHRALRDDRVCAMFTALDVQPETLGGVFHLLDDGDGMVSLDEFVEGIIRLKGSSRTTDLLNLLHDNRNVMRMLRGMEEHFATLIAQTRLPVSPHPPETWFSGSAHQP